MKNTILLLLLSCLSVLGQSQPPTVPGRGGGAPGAITISTGVTPSTYTFANSNTYVLGKGNYPVSPSVFPTNMTAGTTFTGWTLADKTNISFFGVYGQSIIDGSTSAGELLVITNCSQIRFNGLVFKGYTNDNYTQVIPALGAIFAGICIMGSADIIFEDCIIINHVDHGIIDGASGNVIGYTRMSTNNIIIRDCRFEQIGGWRTNNPSYFVDGTAVVPTGWTIENNVFRNVFRGVEPYTDSAGANTPFYNCVIRNNQFYNCIDFAISPASSTNAHGVIVADNIMVNDYVFTYRGTNYGTVNPWASYGIFLNGGRGWVITGNKISGGFLFGMSLQNSASGLDDCIVIGNEVHNLSPGVSVLAMGYDIGNNANSALAANSVGRLIMKGNRSYNVGSVGYNFNACRDCLIDGNFSSRHTGSASVDSLLAGFRIGSGLASTHKMTNTMFINNTAVDGGAGSAYGYSFYTGAAGPGMVFENNRALGFPAGTQGITNNSGNVFAVVGPPRQVQATFDIGNTASLGMFRTNVALTGASTNTFIDVIPPLVWNQGVGSNFVWSAYGSNGFAWIEFKNVSGGAADPASTVFLIQGQDKRINGSP